MLSAPLYLAPQDAVMRASNKSAANMSVTESMLLCQPHQLCILFIQDSGVAQAGVLACRTAAASANTPTVENSDKLKLQLRQAQQMAAAVARKKEDMMMKLKRLTDKQVCTCLLVVPTGQYRHVGCSSIVVKVCF